MKLALIFGQKGNDIKPRILQVKDGLVIDCFNNVQDMIANSKQRNYQFDRIVLLSTIIKMSGNEQYEIENLYDYWRNYAPRTNIVCLCNKGKDDALAGSFTELFNSPLCTSMSVDASTINILVEASTSSIQGINSKYGLNPNIDIEIEMDSIVIPEEPKKEHVPTAKELEEQRKKERHEARAKERERKAQEKQVKGKKGGLFGLFGNKKSEQPQQVDNIQNNEMIMQEQYDQSMQMQEPEISPQFDEEDWEGQYEANIADNNQNSMSPEVGTLEDSIVGVPTYVPEELPESFGDDDVDYSEESEFSEEIVDMPSSTDNSFVEQDFSDNDIEEDLDVTDDSSTEDCTEEYQEEVHIEDTVEVSEDIEELEEKVEQTGLQVEEEIEEDYYEDDFNSEVEEVEEDLGDLEIPTSEPVHKEEVFVQPEDAQEVDEELGGLDVGNLDASYRDKTEAPKVIEREVVKEVVKEVRIKSNVLDNIYAGNTSKIVLVTGDRGSGITTLALDIANAFAKHTQVLYVDGDTELHGSLNYIDYDAFREYEDVHMQGMKLCKSSKAFKNCRIKFDNNLDILSSNFGVVVSDEELETTQAVVAEIAHDYGVVVIDCPIDRINCFHDIILQGNIVLCVEASKRGFMNTLCKLEDSELPVRYKRSIVGKGTMVMTKIHPKLDMKQLIKYVKNIVEFDEIDWLSMNIIPREAKISDKFLSEIIEG